MKQQTALKFDTVIFDLDGTLLDTLDDLTASVNYCMKKFGCPLHSREDVRKMVGNGVNSLLERALPNGRNTPFYSDCVAVFQEYYKNHMLDQTGPFSGIIPMLQALKAKDYKLAVVSNKFDAAVKGLCNDFFSRYISSAIGESPHIARKPAPDTVFKAIEELHSIPSRCIYVGDSEVDIETAANTGIPCISVNWGFKDTAFLQQHHASVIVSSPDELLKEIFKMSDSSNANPCSN
ncbi:Phosphoglycolate phosphatase [uncultured Roseburia sp.]|uniref:HAD-IA family hydrolase n=1 Tax=Brotonthovivens ammoniilytica TaxID=2981725 RepID=A0ABT2TL86_9FIRM|nr:HAD-IA family hydrolase [Brotonthovivens ammoniilytica]MCU6762968.1 HAD-IA family hydrolase [Brotonthovivens ammoniilytica]SCI95270.1 Phosphoglycolate phosphatase [uncultured Roseburia sp.]